MQTSVFVVILKCFENEMKLPYISIIQQTEHKQLPLEFQDKWDEGQCHQTIVLIIVQHNINRVHTIGTRTIVQSTTTKVHQVHIRVLQGDF